MPTRHLAFPVLLLAGLPLTATPAMAWDIQPSGVSLLGKDAGHERIAFLTSGDGAVDSVVATIASAAGEEEVSLVESDSWLHGAATIPTLPAKDARISVYLYSDVTGYVVQTLSGTLGPSGSLTLSADLPTKEQAAYDIALVAAEVFVADGGYDISLDLHGADTYEIAYGEVIVTGSDAVTTRTEVAWDGIGAVWEADLTLVHEGELDVKVRTYDADEAEVDATKVVLGVPWLDGGEGVNVLSTDEDPLTTVAVIGRRFKNKEEAMDYSSSLAMFAVNSEGWTATTVPVAAEVELTNGTTVTIPANSYQRVRSREGFHLVLKNELVAGALAGKSTFTIRGGNLLLSEVTALELATPNCSNGTCVTLVQDDNGDASLSVSEYGTDASRLADTLELKVTLADERGQLVYSGLDVVKFDDDVTAVFANEIGFSGDPLGVGLSGRVSLLGAPSRDGKQSTLAKGKFYARFSRDGDGDLVLAGADRNVVSSKGEGLLVCGPVAFELDTDANKDGVLNPPPLTGILGKDTERRHVSAPSSCKIGLCCRD